MLSKTNSSLQITILNSKLVCTSTWSLLRHNSSNRSTTYSFWLCMSTNDYIELHFVNLVIYETSPALRSFSSTSALLTIRYLVRFGFWLYWSSNIASIILLMNRTLCCIVFMVLVSAAEWQSGLDYVIKNQPQLTLTSNYPIHTQIDILFERQFSEYRLLVNRVPEVLLMFE